MKKIFLFFLLAIFVGCSDDDNDNVINRNIVGSWTLESTSPKEVLTNNDKATQAIKDDIESYIGDSSESYIFTSDGKVTALDGKIELSGTYKLKGNILIIDIYGETFFQAIRLTESTFSGDIDETEYYQENIQYLVPNEHNVSVKKVITTYNYKKL